jgi:hypothetical protein
MEEVVFRKIIAGARNFETGLPPEPGACGTNDFTTYYRANYQPGCLRLLSGRRPTLSQFATAPGEELSIRLDNEYWMLDPRGLTTYWQGNTRDPAAITTSPARAFHHRAKQLYEMMNMGVINAGLESLMWNGDHLTGKAFIPEVKLSVEISGDLERSANDYARAMRVQYRSRLGINDYVLRYDYTTNVGLPFLPSVIRSCLVAKGREIKLAECTLYVLKTSTTPLPRSVFDPQPFLATNGNPILRATNGTFYAKNAVGQWAPLRLPYGQTGFRSWLPGWDENKMYLAAVGLSTIFAFSLGWRINKNQKQQKNRYMKKGMKQIAVLALLLTVATGYATCYLHQVTLCFKSGDVIGTYAPPLCPTSTATAYANENSYQIDQYSVSRGGRATTSYTSYCYGYSTAQFPPLANNNGSFQFYYYSACQGSDETDYNSINNPVYSVTAHYNASVSASCN